ncbi:hypothetical protein BaRGS_00032762 [Batillaria attramentaria]|uniref:Uncharacterized protein n=1 Tax=Batillaria attramentaria TaxID=370345 RepID=A0ABD0JMQ5_9CAEN
MPKRNKIPPQLPLGHQEVCRDDLFAWDAVYHEACSVNFRIHRNIPARFTTAKKQKPSSALGNRQQTRHYAFMKVCQCLEHNDDELTTLTDLVSRMKEFCGDDVHANTPGKQTPGTLWITHIDIKQAKENKCGDTAGSCIKNPQPVLRFATNK